MPKTFTTPDRLFDRTWRPGHPFSPRVSGLRRWFMASSLLVLCVVIGGYWYLTDSARVKGMAEQYLSQLLGGPVRVGDATLSIFEGLRLDKVRLYASDSRQADSLLFSADAFLIQYNPRVLLSGKIEATRIVAVDPHVHVIEDADTGRRNYSRLLESRPPTSLPSGSSFKPVTLPEIVLRNAQLDYTRVRNGNEVVESSSIGVEGQLTPIPQEKIYAFSFQSRGMSTEIGPMVSGRIKMGTGQLTASLQNFEFGPDVKTMLPPEVRNWWEQHGLSGRLNIPVLSYTPPGVRGGKPGYNVEIELQGVTLLVHPEEWMGAAEHRRLRELHGAFDTMRTAGLNGASFIDRIATLVEPEPLALKQVHGRFIFSDDQKIHIEDLNGWLEQIPFEISGQISGYTPAAPAKVRIASSRLHDIEIPAAPRYINSLPPAVREVYDRFKPRGVARFWVELNRPEAGARPRVNGQIDIIDGNFTFENFPYPLRKATGRIVLAADVGSGEESLRIEQIRGKGVEGGPNENATVEINGAMGPFTPEIGVKVQVAAKNIESEPALTAAFPPPTRKALTVFDAPGKGEYPRFKGSFECNIERLRQRESKWIINTSVHLDDASGSLVGFPYFMSGVSGDLLIGAGFVDMKNIAMNRGDAKLNIDGRVTWPSRPDENEFKPASAAIASAVTTTSPASQPAIKLQPDIHVVARDVPIDQALLDALPAGRRAWLQRVGAAGRFDLDGTIKAATDAPPEAPSQDLNLNLGITLHDGKFWPVAGAEGKFAVTDARGSLRLTNEHLSIAELRAKRGDADLFARGEVSWPAEKPNVVIQGNATNLTLDPELYAMLPAPARAAWDQVRPEGMLDVALNYSGGVDGNGAEGGTAATGAGYQVSITPRRLTVTPRVAPYRLEQLTGSIAITPDRVVLKDMSARHGDGTITIAGTGDLSGGADHGQRWDFTLGGRNVKIDEESRKALPQAVAALLESTRTTGVVDFDFTKLHVSTPAPRADDPTTRSASPAAADSSPDADFAVKLSTNSVSLDAGVQLNNIDGALSLTGTSRRGALQTLSGSLDVNQLGLADRTVTKLRAQISKVPDQQQVSIGKIEAQIAGGSMAGQVDYAYPNGRPSRYAVNLILRNADVKQLAGSSEPAPGEQEIQGQASASLALEGTTNQPGSRRGRGDVSVAGRQMYKIPVVLGLLQITNLALPITSPFTEASSRYSIEGQRVTFEQIELRSKEMLMQGSGHLDFDSKQVRLTFVTDSTAWPKVPLIGDLLQGARHELLQIHVKGTLQEPKVSAGSMNTLTTTVDEVLRGDDTSTTSAFNKKK